MFTVDDVYGAYQVNYIMHLESYSTSVDTNLTDFYIVLSQQNIENDLINHSYYTGM